MCVWWPAAVFYRWKEDITGVYKGDDKNCLKAMKARRYSNTKHPEWSEQVVYPQAEGKGMQDFSVYLFLTLFLKKSLTLHLKKKKSGRMEIWIEQKIRCYFVGLRTGIFFGSFCCDFTSHLVLLILFYFFFTFHKKSYWF